MFELFNKLRKHGGSIVRASDISPKELNDAKANGNFFSDGEGETFVWIKQIPTAKFLYSTAVGWGG